MGPASGGERVAMERPFDEGGAQQLERDDDRDQHAKPLQVESPEAEDAAPEPGARPHLNLGVHRGGFCTGTPAA